MNLLLASWRCIILLFGFSISGCPLLPAGCVDVISGGYVTAEPATVLLMGSNLTVYCHTFQCEKGSKMYLDLNKQTVNLSKRVNCTTTAFYLPRVWKPLSEVVCKMKSSQLSALEIICGLDLHLGLPPDKPANINCETTRSSNLVNCSLDRGRETYIDTFYNVSVHRENKSVLDLILDGEEISIPRGILEENTKYTLTVSAYNRFGASRSDPFVFSLADIVIPETPRVVKVEFMNDSTSAVLHWKTSESSMRLRSQIRLRGNNTWEQRAGAELSEGLIRVENLKPETEYEFQIKTCSSTSGQSTSLKASRRVLCSKWSPSVRRMSPEKGPSQQLHVWRSFGGQAKHGLRNVTVFWKPPPVEDYSGELLRYSIVLEDGREEICPAASSQCSVQAPVAVLGLNVSVVTSSGASPPAFVDLRHAGASESFFVKLAPSADGSAAHVSWSTTDQKDLLYFVVEWESMPAAGLQWKKVLKDLKGTTITGLMAGVRYNVSLYAVTTRGVSAPTSTPIYSREQKPLSAPVLHVLTREARRILVRWDELPQDQQRGFISKYTIYLQTLDSTSTELNVTVSGSGQRQMWLDCPEGTLSLQLTASNSAGEGPRGRQTLSQPPAPAVGLVIVIVFIITISIAIVANLMCWSCVRKRIKQKCIAWGPEWLVHNLPKPGHSNAIRLLEDDRSERLFSSIDSDPTLSPILVVSQEERDEAYPTIHVEESPDGAEQAKSLHRTVLVEHTGYKPQIAALVPLDEEIRAAREEQREDPEIAEEDRLLLGFEGFLGGFLSDMDRSSSSHRVTLGSTGDLLWPKTVETSVWKGVCLQEMTRPEEDTENNVSSLDLQQDQREALESDDTCSSPFSARTFLNGGYFPQVASLDVDT
ncbi:PREDICTED: interleukin-12 receptor subunit beta-2-like isoform X1 [Poecilia mexicana]|uniref:Fibronectin type-III domain-containing protein n=1 Tax=Poecilia mexicana TaxID=48701 RepID=A0A3B3WSS2_9TELE|nr:PREDICTED: interleukin-12 receptor subunit beta-2-like isoform X1 [Poecilia mexicana]XP_014842484.1 PREDICTED: interleukin-12 receptor subunit beta-2-like isoform X1 [Poecilia mexicana]